MCPYNRECHDIPPAEVVAASLELLARKELWSFQQISLSIKLISPFSRTPFMPWITFIAGSYQPEQCGVAHYTARLREALNEFDIPSTVLTNSGDSRCECARRCRALAIC